MELTKQFPEEWQKRLRVDSNHRYGITAHLLSGEAP